MERKKILVPVPGCPSIECEELRVGDKVRLVCINPFLPTMDKAFVGKEYIIERITNSEGSFVNIGTPFNYPLYCFSRRTLPRNYKRV